jgi:hypothetical protein
MALRAEITFLRCGWRDPGGEVWVTVEPIEVVDCSGEGDAMRILLPSPRDPPSILAGVV